MSWEPFTAEVVARLLGDNVGAHFLDDTERIFAQQESQPERVMTEWSVKNHCQMIVVAGKGSDGATYETNTRVIDYVRSVMNQS